MALTEQQKWMREQRVWFDTVPFPSVRQHAGVLLLGGCCIVAVSIAYVAFKNEIYALSIIGGGLSLLFAGVGLSTYRDKRMVWREKWTLEHAPQQMEIEERQPQTAATIRAIVRHADNTTETVDHASNVSAENWRKLADYLANNDVSTATRANVQPTSGGAFNKMKEELWMLGIVPNGAAITAATNHEMVRNAANQIAINRPVIIPASPNNAPIAVHNALDDRRRRQNTPVSFPRVENRGESGGDRTVWQIIGVTVLFAAFVYFGANFFVERHAALTAPAPKQQRAMSVAPIVVTQSARITHATEFGVLSGYAVADGYVVELEPNEAHDANLLWFRFHADDNGAIQANGQSAFCNSVCWYVGGSVWNLPRKPKYVFVHGSAGVTHTFYFGE